MLFRLVGKKFLLGFIGDGFFEVLFVFIDIFLYVIKIEYLGFEFMEDCVISCWGYLEENLFYNGVVLI